MKHWSLAASDWQLGHMLLPCCLHRSGVIAPSTQPTMLGFRRCPSSHRSSMRCARSDSPSIAYSGAQVQRRMSFGGSEGGAPRSPAVNMSRRLSTASDCSGGEGASLGSPGGGRMRDCQLGQLHAAYLGLCKKVLSSIPLLTLLCNTEVCPAGAACAPMND
jgi:hypothetical protein